MKRTSIKDKVWNYLSEHVGEEVTNKTLRAEVGPDANDHTRAIRQLRQEKNVEIVYTRKTDSYRLVSTEPIKRTKEEEQKRLDTILQKTSAKDRLRTYFKKHPNTLIDPVELARVGAVRGWERALRSLREPADNMDIQWIPRSKVHPNGGYVYYTNENFKKKFAVSEDE